MYLIFRLFFSCLLLYFLVLIFPSSFWNLVLNIFFFFFPNLLLVFQYLFFFSLSLLVEMQQFFFLSLELSSLLFIVSFFGQGSTVSFFCFFSFIFGVEFFIVHLTFSLSHLKQQSPKIAFYHSYSLLII